MINILLAVLGTFLGTVIGALGILQVLICIFCGITCTNILRKQGIPGRYRKIYTSLFCNILLWASLSFLAIYTICCFGPAYLIFGLKWGLGMSLLLSLGHWGRTEPNVSDYCRNYGKYFETELNAPSKKRFCKYCGSELNPNKKCTKCGKQYFYIPKPKMSKTKALIVFLCIIVACCIAGAITFYYKYTETYTMLHELQSKNEALQSDYDNLTLEYSELNEKYDNQVKTRLEIIAERNEYQLLYKEQKEIADYWNEYGAITTDFGKKYHKYGCSHIQNSSNWYVWNVWDAKNAGYTPCSYCSP